MLRTMLEGARTTVVLYHSTVRGPTSEILRVDLNEGCFLVFFQYFPGISMLIFQEFFQYFPGISVFILFSRNFGINISI